MDVKWPAYPWANFNVIHGSDLIAEIPSSKVCIYRNLWRISHRGVLCEGLASVAWAWMYT